MEQYSILGRIGEGAHGIVFKAKHIETGETVALKKVALRRLEDGIPNQALREIKALQEIEDNEHSDVSSDRRTWGDIVNSQRAAPCGAAREDSLHVEARTSSKRRDQQEGVGLTYRRAEKKTRGTYKASLEKKQSLTLVRLPSLCILLYECVSRWDKYVVEFEDQGSKESGWEELKRVIGKKSRTNLPLWPYMSYRFRVIAINYVGKSGSSLPSEIHNTPAEVPDNNPADVRSESIDPDTLVITWEDIDQRNFNGPDFKYRVQWRRVVGSGPTWHTNYTTTSPFTVSDIGSFSAFEIKVQAVNEQGVGPEPDAVIGYSGEDVPLKAPKNVGIELINSTTLRVNWVAIEKKTVRGHLLGYKVYVTRTGSRGHHRGPESPVVVEPTEEKKLISDLRPYSHYDLAVAVFNSKGEGPPSETLSFNTSEGVPGPPMSLMLDSQSETEMTLRWTPPDHPNGVLNGYALQYQQIVESEDSPLQLEAIDDPTATHFTLKGLDRHSHYRFFLMGRTALGDGEAIMREGATTLDG
ncbi:Neural cell adhesion molecule L1, partial [Dissostichus eleginoides]